ncbi:MAG TPA: hypothetical protein VGB15_19900 [Longimicrobium sp.]
MEFFADRDLGRYEFPGSLRSAGIVVHAHADHFPQNTPDVEWLPEAARRGWVILTNDRKIRSRALELQAVMTSGARVLALVGGSLPAAELARNFINTASKVEEFRGRAPGAVDRPSLPAQPRRRRCPGPRRLHQADHHPRGLAAARTLTRLRHASNLDTDSLNAHPRHHPPGVRPHARVARRRAVQPGVD